MTTLADLLGDDRLGLTPVVDERRAEPLRWVATSELPDPSPYLEGGEVLLTTGLETAGWRRQWDGYVRRLAAAGVVAIGLAVGMTHESSPDGLVRSCRKYRVDLFEVPREIPFVTVSRRLADLLQRDQESAERTALASQRALVQATLREEDPAALLEETARIGGLAAVVGADGQVVAGPVGERPFDAEAVAEAVARMRPQGMRAATALTGPDGVLLVHPLGVRGRPGRYLVTGFAGRPTEMQRSTVTTAVALMSLVEVRHLGRRDADRRLRARAVELLVAGDRRTATVLLGAGSGPRPRLSRSPMVLRARGPRARLDEGLDQVENAGALGGLLGRDGTHELVVVAGESRRLVDGLADRLAVLGLRVGIGADDETAGHALEMTTPAVPVASWADSVGRGVLSLLDDARAASFAASYLAPLEEADDPALVDTLAAYLRHHGSLLQTAEDLGVHRNTVRNRLERIESLLGRSLADPQVRVDAWVALQARK
ncbi:MAG: PucR family transcriptional regulator [Nocardioidaceae bacterium]|nr:PucR family transcriptional regulator [Nocardioidaceae bacterium]